MATQWPLSALEPGTETQCTPSLTHFLFPPSGSGLGPERPYPDWGQEEAEHSPFPFPTSQSLLDSPLPGQGGPLQQEARVGVCEDLRGKGRGGHVDKHAPQAEGGGGVSPETQPQGYIDQSKEIGMLLLWVFFQLFSHNDLVIAYIICILQTTKCNLDSNPGLDLIPVFLALHDTTAACVTLDGSRHSSEPWFPWLQMTGVVGQQP